MPQIGLIVPCDSVDRGFGVWPCWLMASLRIMLNRNPNMSIDCITLQEEIQKAQLLGSEQVMLPIGLAEKILELSQLAYKLVAISPRMVNHETEKYLVSNAQIRERLEEFLFPF